MKSVCMGFSCTHGPWSSGGYGKCFLLDPLRVGSRRSHNAMRTQFSVTATQHIPHSVTG